MENYWSKDKRYGGHRVRFYVYIRVSGKDRVSE
jgi:hypothetical protein